MPIKNGQPVRKIWKHISSYSLTGFALIEIAFVLIIIGIIGSFGLPAIRLIKHNAQQKQTVTHQTQVIESIKSFIAANHRLPCPSSNAHNQGVEYDKCINNSSKCIGIVPYKTLGISKENAKDGFGHWLTYSVEPQLTISHQSLQDLSSAQEEFLNPSPNFMQSLCHAKGSKLKVINNAGEKVFTVSPVSDKHSVLDFIAFVLISHGSEGAGAYNSNSIGRIPNMSELEEENGNDDLVFREGIPHSKGQNLFRHRVYWITKNNLMSSLGVHCKKKESVSSFSRATSINNPHKKQEDHNSRKHAPTSSSVIGESF